MDRGENIHKIKRKPDRGEEHIVKCNGDNEYIGWFCVGGEERRMDKLLRTIHLLVISATLSPHTHDSIQCRHTTSTTNDC